MWYWTDSVSVVILMSAVTRDSWAVFSSYVRRRLVAVRFSNALQSLDVAIVRQVMDSMVS